MAFLFENLIAYTKAMELTRKIFYFRKGITNRIIKDQLCRAALSIPLNIAEGQGRVHQREKKQFYNTAKGSLYECLPLAQICFDLNYIDKGQYQDLYDLMNELGKILAGLIKSVKQD